MPVVGWLVAAVVKGSMLLACVWLLSRLPAWSAAQRHALLATALLAQAIVLLLIVVVPEVTLPLPGSFWRPVRDAVADGQDRLPQSTMVARDASMAADVVRSSDHPVVSPRAEPAHAATTRVWRLGILLVWAAGTVLLLGRVTRAMWWARRRVTEGRPMLGRRWVDDLRSAQKHLRIRGVVRLLVHEEFVTPVCLDVFAPAIVLPREADTWSLTRRRAVLLHELAHVKRRDPVTQVFGAAVCALLWPNPLVWIVSRGVHREAERACDDVVISGGLKPSAYVLELVAMARHLTRRTSIPATPFVARLSLEARARSLLTAGRSRTPASARRTTALVLGVVLGAAGMAAVHPVVGLRHALAVASCVHDGGRLRNRLLASGGGARVWEVYWDGDDCSVRLEAQSTTRRPLAAWVDADGAAEVRLDPQMPGDSLTIVVTGEGRDLHAVLVRDGRGRLHRTLRVNGQPRPFDRDAVVWLRAFTLAVDRHTGFAAGVRLPGLLAEGGVEAVLDEAAAARGDHAAGIYLTALLEARQLNDPRLERLLGLVADRVRNEAVLVGLLERVAQAYRLDGERAQTAFQNAYNRLRTRAGRETVAAVRGG